ncbi:hypothetical protein [Chroococcidiopsis sp. CCMEE 29]|uniref:hypothetical protein n=1 Tax=Chroococcidiopsis sp. CCMEE 29 TaxID=155894 RepID=UPI00201FEA08|nr:hypothetical protein [Chroococcidiopsis sp. CCMEE 29]
MTRTPLQDKDDFEHSKGATQVDVFGDSPVNHALTAVAQEVVELLKQAYPIQTDGINHTGTINIRTVEPEYRQIIDVGEYPSSFTSLPTSTADQ